MTGQVTGSIMPQTNEKRVKVTQPIDANEKLTVKLVDRPGTANDTATLELDRDGDGKADITVKVDSRGGSYTPRDGNLPLMQFTADDAQSILKAARGLLGGKAEDWKAMADFIAHPTSETIPGKPKTR